MAEKLVPTLCVGMPSSTLRVVRSRPRAAERPGGIPTQSVGTSDPISLLQSPYLPQFRFNWLVQGLWDEFGAIPTVDGARGNDAATPKQSSTTAGTNTYQNFTKK